MISGENYVISSVEKEQYSSVRAYAVDTLDSTIISGGTGDEAVITQGTRFLWRYAPNNLADSGFTGLGWFTDTPNTPLYGHFASDDEVNEYFANGGQNLNYYFEAWQEFINSQTGTTDYVGLFISHLTVKAGAAAIASQCYSKDY